MADSPILAAVYGLGSCIFTFVPLNLRRSRSVGAAAHHLALGWFTIAFMASLARGGIAAPAIGLTIAAPMIATLLLGPRAGIGWFALGLSWTVILLIMKKSGVELPDRVPAESRPVVQAVMAAIFMTTIVVIAVGYEVLRAAALADAEQRAEELRLQQQARLRAESEARVMTADRMASIGRLAAGIAHEINNPLSYLLTNVQLIREEIARLPERERSSDLIQAIDDAVQGATNIRSIVRDLKTFARADEEQLCAVDVHEVLESTLRMTANEARHRARVVRGYGEIGLALGNPARLAQVFLNVLVNAIESFQNAELERNEIKVRTMRLAASEIAIEISDTGSGIAPELLAHVVDPFFTTKPVGEGTGLGLSVSRSIVARFGGRLEIESVLGAGTTVRVVLPAYEAAPSAECASRAEPIIPAVVSRRARILIIDDDEHVARALKRLLRDHDVTMSHDACKATALLEERPEFDLVFCDLMMPERTGMEIYAHLEKRHPELAERFVFISGGVFDRSARAFVDSVRNRFVEKPFDRKAVLAMVEAFLPRSTRTGPTDPRKSIVPKM
jgi:signal transduction histidine kinase/ActR/RegA family two-component response regulator